MSTTAELIYEWLSASGPAKVDAIRAGLPDVNPKTVSDLLSRLHHRGKVTRSEDGTWAAVVAEVPELDPVATLGTLQALREDMPTLVPLPWLEMLGAEVPEAPRCDDCGYRCSNPPMRYTGDHTAIVCPECGPDCWDISPRAAQRAEAHAAGLRRRADRAASAAVTVPQQVRDREARELKRRREVVLAGVRKILADEHLTPACRSDYEWFAEEIADADAARLAELEAQLRKQPVTRAGWWRRSFGAGGIPEYLEWIAEEGDQDEADEEPDPDADDEEPDAEDQEHAPGEHAPGVIPLWPARRALPARALPAARLEPCACGGWADQRNRYTSGDRVYCRRCGAVISAEAG